MIYSFGAHAQSLSDDLFSRAMDSFSQGEYLQAGRLFYASAQKAEPGTPPGQLFHNWHNAGVCFRYLQMPDSALLCLRHALKGAPAASSCGLGTEFMLAFEQDRQPDSALYWAQWAAKQESIPCEQAVTLGSFFVERQDFARARRMMQADRSPADSSCKSGLLIVQAQFYEAVGQPDSAASCARALMSTPSAELNNTLSAYKILSNYFINKNQIDSAYFCEKKIVAISAQLGIAEQEALSLLTLAQWELAKNNIFESQTYVEQAIGKARASNNGAILAQALSIRGALYKQQGYYKDAQAQIDQAQALFDQLGDLESSSACTNNSAVIDLLLSNYAQAARKIERLQQMAHKSGEDAQGTLWLNIGGVYFEWGDIDQAYSNYQKALEIGVKTSNGLLQARALNNLANSCLMLQNTDKAIGFQNQAIALFDALHRPEDKLSALNTMGHLLLKSGRYGAADSLFDQGLEASKKLAIPSLYGQYLEDRALSYTRSGDYQRALELHRQSAAIRQSMGELKRLSISLNNAAIAAIELGRNDTAERFLEQSVRITELLCDQATGKAKRDFMNVQMDAYSNLATVRLNQGNKEGCFAITELSRSKYLKHLLGKQAPVGPLRLSQAQLLLGDSTFAIMLAGSGTRSIVVLAISSKNIESKSVSKDELVNKLLAFPELRRPLAAKLKLADLKSLPIFSGLPQPMSPELAEKTLNALLLAYRDMLASESYDDVSAAKKISAMLYQELLAPFKKQISESKKIIVLPDGAFCYIPFEALRPTGDEPAPPQHPIRYIGSFAVLSMLNFMPPPAPLRHAAVYSVGDYSCTAQAADTAGALLRAEYVRLGYTRFGSLSLAGEEANVLDSAGITATKYRESAASKQAVIWSSKTEGLRLYGLLHFSAHGIGVADVPERSALVLSCQETGDWFLTASDIRSLKLSAGLVSLSSCSSNVGRLYLGEGISSLSSAFTAAGARNVVSTLWEVNEQASMLFMKRFYRYLLTRKLPPSQALAQTKSDFEAGLEGLAYRLPCYWAAFVVTGSDAVAY